MSQWNQSQQYQSQLINVVGSEKIEFFKMNLNAIGRRNTANPLQMGHRNEDRT